MSSDQRIVDLLSAVVDRTQASSADIKEIKADIGMINVSLAVNTRDLQVHMARTEALEAVVAELRKQSSMIQGIGMFLGLIGLLASIYAALK